MMTYATPTIDMTSQEEVVSDNAFWIPIILWALSAGTTASILVWNNNQKQDAIADCYEHGAYDVDVESKYLGAAWEVSCKFPKD